MRSLRSRIAAVMALSIVAVFALATLVTVAVMERMRPRDFSDPMASQVINALRLMDPAARVSGDPATLPSIAAAPAAGDQREHFARMIQDELAKQSLHNKVVVTRQPQDSWITVSVEMPGRGWLLLPMPPGRGPPPIWSALAGWSALVVVGAIIVAVAIARRVTRPLSILEDTANQIGSGGDMPKVAESGPAEVKATARALNRLTRNLREAMESRMRLVAAAGHDLRTPITRMRLRAEFLPEADRGGWLRDLDELQRIADSSIELVREQVGGRPRSTFRLDSMICAVAEELSELGLPVVTGPTSAAVIEGAPTALVRAIRNLIVNAATHGKGAEVSIETTKREAIIYIDDRGPGIPDADLDRVFEPFFRADPGRRQHVPGAGLGLAIAAEIVAHDGGALKLENRPAGGLRQEIRFPLALDPSVEAETIRHTT